MKTYAQNFKDRPQPVFRQSLIRRKQLQQYIQAIQKRVEIQEIYARNLFNIAKSVQNFKTNQTTSSLSFSAFQLSNQNRAMQSYTFSKSLKEQVLQKLKQTLQIQTQQSIFVEKEIQKLDEELNMYLNGIKKPKYKYLQIEKQSQQILFNYQLQMFISTSTKNQKLRLKNKSKEIYQQIQQQEYQYKKALSLYNKFRNYYYKQIQNYLDTLQKHEEKRLQLQLDSVMKILIFETSMIKNFQYDIINISKQIDQKDVKSDIIKFVSENEKQSNQKAYNLRNQCEYRSFLKETIYTQIRTSFQQKINFDKDNQIKKNIQKISKGEQLDEQDKEYNFLIVYSRKIWRCEQIQQKQRIQLKKQLEIKQKRIYLFKIIYQFLSICKFKIPPQKFQKVSNFVIELFVYFVQIKDIFIIRRIIILAFNSYTQLQSKNNNLKIKQYIFQQMKSIQILRHHDIWTASIFQSIQEQLYLINKKNTNLQQIRIREKSTIVNQLAQYSHYTVHLGLSIEKIRNLINKFCEIYRLTQQDIKNLGRVIIAAQNQLKQKNLEWESISSKQKNEADK